MSRTKLAMAGRWAWGRAAETGLPAAVEVLDLAVVHLLVGQHHEVGLGRIAQEVSVEAQAVFAHVHRQPRRGHRRQPGVLLQRVEVTEPHHLVGRQRQHPAAPVVDEAADVFALVRHDGHPVGAQRPDFAVAIGVAVQHPVGRSPEVQVDFGGAPQVGASVPAVDPLQQLLRRVLRPHGEAQPAGLGTGAAVDHHRRAGQGLGPDADGRVDRRGGGVVFAVFRSVPPAARAGEQSEVVCVGPGDATGLDPCHHRQGWAGRLFAPGEPLGEFLEHIGFLFCFSGHFRSLPVEGFFLHGWTGGLVTHSLSRTCRGGRRPVRLCGREGRPFG